MPVICIYGIPVRVRPMLNAIGAQEDLEQYYSTKPQPHHGATRLAAWERGQRGRARLRNTTEQVLRPEERVVWQAWRKASTAEREAVRAVLTDLPGREEGKPQV